MRLSPYSRSGLVIDQEKHMYCTNKFIQLANELKEEGVDVVMVSGSLMTASSIYATYVAAGNNGALEASGIDKVVRIYRRTLEHHQVVKKAQLQEQGKT
jgi:phosphoserine phosphatase